jgi:hypothetical protein
MNDTVAVVTLFLILDMVEVPLNVGCLNAKTPIALRAMGF